MRLSDEYKLVAEQLNDLYQYKKFLEERITMLELKLKEFSDMMDYADNLAVSGITEDDDRV
jgi:hypothetical protein